MAQVEQNQKQNSRMILPAKDVHKETRPSPGRNQFTDHGQVLGNQAIQHLLISQLVQAKPNEETTVTSQGASKPNKSNKRAPEKKIESDLKEAKSWTEKAAKKINRYAKRVKSLAESPKISYRISTTPSGRGETLGLRCALLDNFNVDPQTDEPIYYASRILTINDRLTKINNTLNDLKYSDFQVPPNHEKCGGFKAYVEKKSLPIYLCPSFFLFPSRNPATIIHEVAHLRGMDDLEYNKKEGEGLPASNCWIHSRFSIGSDQTVRNPDSYAFFCADLRSKEK